MSAETADATRPVILEEGTGQVDAIWDCIEYAQQTGCRLKINLESRIETMTAAEAERYWLEETDMGDPFKILAFDPDEDKETNGQ